MSLFQASRLLREGSWSGGEKVAVNRDIQMQRTVQVRDWYVYEVTRYRHPLPWSASSVGLFFL